MRRISAHDAKQNFGAVLEYAQGSPVEILKYRRRFAVILSAKEFDELEALRIIEAKRKIAGVLAKIEAADENSADGMVRALPHILRRIEKRGNMGPQ